MLSSQRAVPDPERASFDAPRIGSDRNFGVVFAAFFLLLALWPLVRGESIRIWSLIAAGVFVAAAFFSPHIFSLPNRLWFRFGLLLGKVLTPIIMGTLFLAVVVPVALVMRLLGKATIPLRPDPSLESYWLPKASALTPETLKDQF